MDLPVNVQLGLGLCLALLQHALLHTTAVGPPLADWVLSDAPRDSLFAANRELLASVNGYFAIYLLGAWLGRSVFRRK